MISDGEVLTDLCGIPMDGDAAFWLGWEADDNPFPNGTEGALVWADEYDAAADACDICDFDDDIEEPEVRSIQ